MLLCVSHRRVSLSLGLLLVLLLGACGGGGGGGGGAAPAHNSVAQSRAASVAASLLASTSSLAATSQAQVASSQSSFSAQAKPPAPDLTPDPNLPLVGSPNYSAARAAVRLLTQATFGPTAKDIDALLSQGQEAWLAQQMHKPQTKHLPLLDQRFEQLGWVAVPPQDNSDEGYQRDLQRSDIWWEVSLWGEDQLRQRVAYALSQILVISNVSDVLYNDTRGIANYQDILAAHAFGNYRDLLKAVTLNPMMGEYLSMVRNEKADVARNIRPDENYARELMQLFTIGLVELNLDGSPKLDPQGEPIPTYDQTTVKELARVFTGWNMGTINNWWEWTDNAASEVVPMKAFLNYHDRGEKILFGNQLIAAGKTPEQDLDAALDIIFAHSNLAPFIAKQLIQRLVTSNPSPAYVERVATVFNNNGAGVKGDLAAVIKSLLLDEEAQQGHTNDPQYFGKLREPLLKVAHLWRAFKATGTPTQFSGGKLTPPRIRYRGSDRTLGQRPYGAFSVFNFYRPDYQPPGAIKTANLVAPEFQILTESMIMANTNSLSEAVFWRDSPSDWLEPVIDGNWDIFTPRLHLDRERALSANPAALLNHLNLLLMAGQMSEPMYELLLEYMNANKVNPNWDVEGQRWARDTLIYDALLLIMVSPEYAVQR